MFTVAIGVSPQLFYAFYRQVFPDLPWQWVIQSALDFERNGQLLLMQSIESSADLLAALVLWLLLVVACWRHLPVMVSGSGQFNAILVGLMAGTMSLVWTFFACVL